MTMLVVSIPVVAAVASAVVFRNSRAVRVCCVAVVLLVAGINATYLIAGHRLLLEKGGQHFADPVTKRAPEEMPKDFMFAVDVVQDLNWRGLGLYVLTIGAFAVLALIPVRDRAKNNFPTT